MLQKCSKPQEDPGTLCVKARVSKPPQKRKIKQTTKVLRGGIWILVRGCRNFLPSVQIKTAEDMRETGAPCRHGASSTKISTDPWPVNQGIQSKRVPIRQADVVQTESLQQEFGSGSGTEQSVSVSTGYMEKERCSRGSPHGCWTLNCSRRNLKGFIAGGGGGAEQRLRRRA